MYMYTSVQKNLQIYFQIHTNHHVFIYEAPNMSTETLQFPLDIPKYLITIATYSQTSL